MVSIILSIWPFSGLALIVDENEKYTCEGYLFFGDGGVRYCRSVCTGAENE
jgi:hypothetical protein